MKVGLSVSERVQRESEQLANEGTSVNEGWKIVSICVCSVFLVFLAIESTVLIKCSGKYIEIYFSFKITLLDAPLLLFIFSIKTGLQHYTHS